MSLTSCLAKAGTAINAEDRAAIVQASGKYRKEGMTAAAAAIKAVEDRQAAVQEMLDGALAGKPTRSAESPNDQPAAASERDGLQHSLRHAIVSVNMPRDNPALRKMVEAFDGKAPDQARMKVAQEDLEAAIVSVARDIVDKGEGDRTTFDNLKRLYDSQPNLNIRTSTSIDNQAYSTPAPLAFLGARLADVTHQTTVYEPTGGNGMLAITAKPSNVTATELEARRADSLKAQGFNVTQGDALKAQVPAKSQDRVMTNPPFGPIKDAQGESIKVKFDGYTLGQIDHLIAARALETLKDDGKATLIIGANKAVGQQSNNDLIFFNWLYGNYRVTSHFEVEGDLYQRQGAGWPVRVITIEGRFRSPSTAPRSETIKRANTWSEVYEQFQNSMESGRPAAGHGERAVGGAARQPTDDAGPVPGSAAPETRRADSSRPEGSAPGDGNVAGKRPGPVGDRAAAPDPRLGERSDAVGSNDQAPGPVEDAGIAVSEASAQADRDPRTAGVTSANPDNQFQTTYISRSSRKDEGVLIPVNMAGPTQDALNRLEDEVGNIDQFAAKELGYKSVDELHRAFMGLQVDSVASAISQIKAGKGVIIADQTGIGKGRQAAGVIRWAARNGKVPIFVTVKPSLFTDMYGDLHDIGTDDIQPLLMNVGESIKGTGDERLFANQAGLHRRVLEGVAGSGALPAGRNALFMTYSQINVDNMQRKAVMALAPNAVFVLDESHNAGGASATGEFIKGALDLASGVTYLSATYAKRPDNMPVYFKTDIGDAVADDDTLMAAMAAGGLPLQTVVSNNLVKAGQMFRRERSYDGVSIESRADTEHRAEHVKLSDETTLALRAIVSADRTFHHAYVKALQDELKEQGSRVLDMAGNQAQQSVDHAQFSSVVHNFVRQMLLGLKAQEAANDAILSLKRGEKPLIAVENTMGSFLSEYAENNSVKPGDSLGLFDYRAVLSRALERSRYIVRQLPNGDKVKEYIPMSKLDPASFQAYTKAQDIIDGLKIDIPVSPIDWMRDQITKAGFSVAEITGRNLSVDYVDPKNPKLSQIDAREQKDKVRTTRRFNDGTLDAIILNVAGSTGISLHASEKFRDQRQRHMIVAQAAQDINIFMQMLGRIHRTGQVVLPKYTLLSADLPAEIRPTALLSGKMKSLNANTSSNTESATSVKAADMLNKYGDAIVQQYLADNHELAQALDLESTDVDADQGGEDDIARRATGRLALMPVKVQEQFYAEVEEQYQALIDYLNKTNQNDLEPRTFDFDAQETKSAVLFEGQNKASPFGEDALYGEYSVKAQGKAMTPSEIRAAMAEHLGDKTPAEHLRAAASPLQSAFNTMRDGIEDDEQKAKADGTARAGAQFLDEHRIGSMFRVDISGETYNAVVTNIRSTHKATGNPFSLSKIQVTIAVNGALRSVTLPATQFGKIEVSRITGGYGSSIESAFREGPPNERETAKIVTGNLLGAYGEIEGARGSIITFSKADGTTEQGILLPKAFNFAKDVRQDYRLKTAADVFQFLTTSTNENIERFGINSRDSVVRVLPAGQDGITIQVPKSKAKGGKYFLDKGLRAAAGDFVSAGNFMRATVRGQDKATKALEVLMQKGALYALPSMAEEAARILGDDSSNAEARFSRGHGAGIPLNDAKAVVAAIREANPSAPPIHLLDSVNKAPDKLLADIKKAGAQADVEAAYHDGEIYVFYKNIGSIERALFVVGKHEIRHHGLRSMLGDRLGPVLMRMGMQNPALRDAARAKMKAGHANDFVTGVEEALADMPVEALTKLTGWERIVAAFRAWARKVAERIQRMHPNLADLIAPKNWTDADVALMVIRAEGVSRGGAAPFRASGTAFGRTSELTKSTGNAGTFDATNPDIRFSRATPGAPQQTVLQQRRAASALERLRNAGGGPKIIGNTSRAYTPEQLAAMTNVGMQVQAPTLEERAKAIWKDAGKRLAQGMVDQFAPVKDISATAYGLLRLSKGASGAFEAMLQGGRLKLTDGVYDFDEQKRGGVLDTLLKPLGGEHHDFFRWIAANRAERLMSKGKENLFTAGDIAALKSLANGVTSFDYTLQHGERAGQKTRDRTLIYADALKTFNQFNTNVLDMAEESGLIDGEARALWENEFYVPFYRVEEDGSVAGADIKNGAVRQQAFKSLTGRTEKLNADLLDNTLMNWAHLLDAAAKNRAAKASIEAAEGMGAAEPIEAHQGKGSVWFRENGEKRWSMVNDPYLLTAITALEYQGAQSPAMRVMGAFKRALTVGVTASPFFKVRNLIRDSVQAIGTSPLGYNPAANIAQGWKLTDPKSDAYFRLLAGGGTIHFGTMLEGSEAKRVQALVESGVDQSTILNSDQKFKAFYRKFIEPGITAYNELGNRGEAINRASLYAQLKAQGMSHAEASLQARDLMDFSMQGSYASVRFLAQVVPFFNARIQGLYKLGRAAKEDPQRFSMVIGAAALMGLALVVAYGDDEDWKKREDWDRNNFWWFKVGGVAFRIPKPFEIGAIATLAERGFELAFDKEMTGARFRQQVLTLLGDNLSMNPIPQLVKPMLDVYANKDSFTGRPIETMGMERLQPAFRFNANTSMTARAISTAANAAAGTLGAQALSPLQVDHLLRGYFGWLGTFVVGAGDVLARPATGQPSKPDSDLFKAATGGMVSDLRDAPSRYVTQMYQQATAIEQAYATWKRLIADGKGSEAGEFFADNRDAIVKHRLVEGIKKAEGAAAKEIHRVELSDMSAADKRERIRTLLQRKDRIARPISEVH